MSIFKRFSGKKAEGKASKPDAALPDETAILTESDSSINLPVSVDDAVPSLKGFTPGEQEVIRSILDDNKTPKSNFHKTNRKTEADVDEAPEAEVEEEEASSEFMGDESFVHALKILKGDLQLDAVYGIDEPETESPEAPELSDSESKAAEEVDFGYPEKLTASATFRPSSEIEEPEEARNEIENELEEAEEIISEIDEPAEIINPEVESEPESASDTPLILGENDMSSRNEYENERDSTYELRRQADHRHDDIANTQRRINLGEMRMDVASIISDIENGDNMYRRAQQRVENLNSFIQRAEVDFSLLDRLEPENRALKSENLTLQSELDKRKTRISQLTTSLEDLQRRFGDAQSELDATHGSLAQSIKNFERAERDISELNAQIQEHRLKSDRVRNDLDVENRENSNLRDRIADLTTQLDTATSEKLHHAKQIETLKIDVADQSENRLQLRDEVTNLRNTLEDAQSQNTRMRGEITGVHDDIRGFKTQYEFNILKRDERISDLETQIVELNDRLRIKEEQVETSTRELSIIRKERTTQELERERLEKSVEQANSQLHRTEEELLRSRKAADELDMKYRDVAAALDRTEQRRQASPPAAKPDIAPPPYHPAEPKQAAETKQAAKQEAITKQEIETDDIELSAAPAPAATSSAAPVAERIAPTRQITDDIEDMLTDYKLGIRNLG